MTRQVEQDMPVENDGSHIANVGRLIEDMESKMRGMLREFITLEVYALRANRTRGGILRQGKGCRG